MTLDIPIQFLPSLERQLSSAGLEIRPYVKSGAQRWQLAPRSAAAKTSIPETLIAAGVEEAA